MGKKRTMAKRSTPTAVEDPVGGRLNFLFSVSVYCLKFEVCCFVFEV